MPVSNLFEDAGGLVLLFFLPGYATTKALFPEWRVRGVQALRRALETVTLSFVLSVAWTVVVGYGLLELAPGGFQAAWSDPELEAALALVTLGAVGVGAWMGAYSRVPPERPPTSAVPGEEGAWELTRRLDRLAREDRRLRHALRTADPNGPESDALRAELERVSEESSRLRQEREREYAS
jgi:pimeloyl-ACP methyl ester carboxylesterase